MARGKDDKREGKQEEKKEDKRKLTRTNGNMHLHGAARAQQAQKPQLTRTEGKSHLHTTTSSSTEDTSQSSDLASSSTSPPNTYESFLSSHRSRSSLTSSRRSVSPLNLEDIAIEVDEGDLPQQTVTLLEDMLNVQDANNENSGQSRWQASQSRWLQNQLEDTQQYKDNPKKVVNEFFPGETLQICKAQLVAILEEIKATTDKDQLYALHQKLKSTLDVVYQETEKLFAADDKLSVKAREAVQANLASYVEILGTDPDIMAVCEDPVASAIWSHAMVDAQTTHQEPKAEQMDEATETV